MKFPIERIPSYPILKFWDFGQIMTIMAIRPIKSRNSKLIFLRKERHEIS
jgi:hypothetical protein